MQPGPRNLITDVDGLLVGNAEEARLRSGVTVVLGERPFVASCSHLMEPPVFADQVKRGLRDAERTGRILRSSGAALDHPVHPNLPETAYLKALTLQLD